VSAETLSIADAADALGLSQLQVYRLAAKGKIPGAFRPSPRRWRISRVVFERALADPAMFATEGNK
jgi:excisionase family DNA binding protein